MPWTIEKGLSAVTAGYRIEDLSTTSDVAGHLYIAYQNLVGTEEISDRFGLIPEGSGSDVGYYL